MLPAQQIYIHAIRLHSNRFPRSLPHLKLPVSSSLWLHSPRCSVALDIPRNSRSSFKYDSSFVNSDFVLLSPYTCFINISTLCTWILRQMTVRQCWESGSEGELKIWYYNKCYILPHKQCSKHCSNWKVYLQEQCSCYRAGAMSWRSLTCCYHRGTAKGPAPRVPMLQQPVVLSVCPEARRSCCSA